MAELTLTKSIPNQVVEAGESEAIGSFELRLEDKQGLEAFLKASGRIAPIERIVKLSSAGEGNMNLTARVQTNGRSFILKQSRPWVAKYPQIAAPIGRAQSEASFYQFIRGFSLAEKRMPELRFFDARHSLLSFENLGEAADYSSLYREGILREQDIETLSSYLLELHREEIAERAKAAGFSNRAMLELNAEHLFYFPLRKKNEGFSLDTIQEGLSSIALDLMEDAALKKEADQLAQLYLSESGNHLLHGDFYPGSWLKTSRGLKVIDPEFCFLGPKEFDLGVSLAHLTLSRQPKELIETFLKWYARERSFEMELVKKFAGIEMIRRLIGIAQLPLELRLEEKEDFLNRARAWIVKAQ